MTNAQCSVDLASAGDAGLEHIAIVTDNDRNSLFKIGTRGSELAQIQARRVKARLEAQFPSLECELVIISTIGDRDKQTPLTIIGGQGVFAKELQQAIFDGRVDCAVHSLKDLPSILPEGLILAAVLDRDDPRDVFLSPTGATLAELPPGARVGTSSRRRMAQILHARPDVEIVELRGNVDTRVNKVMNGSPEGYDGAILAAAGIRRMGYSEMVAETLDLDRFTPAPGQAALGVDCRLDDLRARELLAAINDAAIEATTTAERAFLREFGGGCTMPIGAHATLAGDAMTLRVMVADDDLAHVRSEQHSGSVADVQGFAADAGQRLRAGR